MLRPLVETGGGGTFIFSSRPHPVFDRFIVSGDKFTVSEIRPPSGASRPASSLFLGLAPFDRSVV